MNRKKYLENSIFLSAKEKTFRLGMCYETARVGYYQENALALNNAEAWHQLAACEFLVFNDFDASFIAFMNALKLDKGVVGEMRLVEQGKMKSRPAREFLNEL